MKKHQALTGKDAHVSEDYFSKEKGMRYDQNTLPHLRFGRRLVLVMRLRFDVLQARAAPERHLASLRSLLLPIFGGVPLLPGRDGDSGPPSLLSSDEGIFIPPDTKSEVPWE